MPGMPITNKTGLIRTMKTYLQLLQDILDKGSRKEDRTGTGTISLFGYQMRFDLCAGVSLCDHQETASALHHS